MRLQIAALPRDDPTGPAPFLIVLDEVSSRQIDILAAAGPAIRTETGASAVLIVEGRIQVVAARDTRPVVTVDDIIAAAATAP